MSKVLITGMSGTGKSTVLGLLASRGHRVVDTDTDEWSHWVTQPDGSADWIWRPDAITALLTDHRQGSLFVAGCKSNQGTFYPLFDHIALLSAPTDVLLSRIATRTTNPYGKTPEQRADILRYAAEVEPLLRATATIEIDATQPLPRVVREIESLIWDSVLLARHGQTQWNVARRRQGQLDSPLTPVGLEQAHRHAATLETHPIDGIFASPQGRAHTTAEIIGAHLSLPVQIIDELAELHHGSYAGLTNAEINARYPGELASRAADKYEWRFPGGESYADADVRAGQALARIATRHPLIVTHEMIGRMLQRHLLDLDPAAALTTTHPQDIVYEIDPSTRTRRDIR
jgi:broad specificity phosphatase PhoE/shikimate kinase